MTSITSFRSAYSFLSNFFPSPIQWGKHIYPTVEHAYQAAKTIDEDQRLMILACQTPGAAKRLGRQVTLDPNWESIKLEVMYNLLRKKFSVPNLANLLLNTGDAELIEENNWGDQFWGKCNGLGHNHLGILLMRVRAKLRSAL